jgi:mono/diheme cytochrome c family protein
MQPTLGPSPRPLPRRCVWVLALVALALAGWAAEAISPQAEPTPELARGAALFQRHCAACHGTAGDGRGEAAYLLSPAPRDFGSGRFRLVSTQNGAPTDADLVATLENGMPGSAMPAFDWMSASDLASLALHVRELARAGIVRGLLAWAEEEGEELSEEEAREIAAQRTQPGPAVEPGEPPVATPELRERGRELFVELCAPCHGADGRAREVDVQWNEDGTPTLPRDFTAGLFKGGSEPRDIVTRLLSGLPGSPMPATELADRDDAWALAYHVRSLFDPAARERVLQRRKTLAVHRATGALPLTAEAAAWRAVEPTHLALMPLWWRNERVEAVEVRALHDGERIAFHLSWEDPAPDQELGGHETFTDAAALQISAEADPPIFTMGAPGEPVNLWNWKAAWELDGERARGVSDRYPNTPDDLHPHVPAEMQALFLTARAAGNRQAAPAHPQPIEELTAQGFGTLGPIVSAGGGLEGRATWTEGRWRLVFVRRMRAPSPAVVSLEPGRTAFVAAAVWDGAASDRNGQKSVTVWHALEIEP